jgi:hypothetical protein
MKIINLVAAVCSIVSLPLSTFLAYVLATENGRHKVTATVLAILVAMICVSLCIAYYQAYRAHSNSAVAPKNEALKPQLSLGKDRIYIGPAGTPLSLVNEKLRIGLTFFACNSVQLLFVKVRLGNSQTVKVTLSDAEPHELKGSERFTKTLERSLNDEELQILKTDLVLVEGIAKFAGNLEVPFQFDATTFRI